MELKHLKSFILSQNIDENFDKSDGKSYLDSTDFENAHSKIESLLKQVSMLIKSKQHANWIRDTDNNYGADEEGVTGEELYYELIDKIDETIKANNALYEWLVNSS